MLVENNPLFRRFLESALPQYYAAFDFLFADSAQSARKKIENLTDLYCLVTNYDLGAGQSNGIQLAEEIRGKFPNVKVILIAPEMDEYLIREANRHGIYNCASKYEGLYRWIKFIEF